MSEEQNLYLVYVEPIGKNLLDFYEYEFIFSETPEIVWGNDWEQTCPSICGDLRPEPSTYSVTKRLKSIYDISVAQKNSCLSMQDVIDGILCVAWIFNENMTVTFKFGEPYFNVINKLEKIGLSFM